MIILLSHNNTTLWSSKLHCQSKSTMWGYHTDKFSHHFTFLPQDAYAILYAVKRRLFICQSLTYGIRMV